MSDRKTLQIKQISGHSGPAPGFDVQRDYEVCKLVDTTTCIGCKACEVACVEWNDMPFSPTVFENNYQTMPELTSKCPTLTRVSHANLKPYLAASL